MIKENTAIQPPLCECGEHCLLPGNSASKSRNKHETWWGKQKELCDEEEGYGWDLLSYKDCIPFGTHNELNPQCHGDCTEGPLPLG